jgi:PAS domain S-box-containing protein
MSHDRTDPTSLALDQLLAYGVASVAPNGEVLRWNAGASALAGISAEQACGSLLDELISVEAGSLAPQKLEALAGRAAEAGLWLRRADGSRFWGKVAVVAAPSAGDDRAGYVVFLRDATSLKAARDELERSKTMFEGILAIASDAVICVDETQRIVFFNEGAERIFQYAPHEVLGQPLTLLVPERFRSDHEDHVRRFSGSPVVARQMGERGEISGRRKSGEVFPAEASISRLEVGDGRIYTAVLRDATDRRTAQEALARQAEELARSNADLEQFAYVASHDLQEPLRMVASYTQLLARRYGDKLDQDAHEFIGFAVDGVTRMQALINDLLAYSRVGTRGGAFSRVPVETVVERVRASLARAIEESGALVSHDPLPAVTGDPTQLLQLFQNLIQNGIKFRHPDSPPEIHIGVSDQGAVWHFSVRDNGIGIAPEYQERIFVIFQRLHPRSEYPGTGIGLSICKKIVERHGGRIWVESESDAGSTFHFTLPKEEE